MYYTRHLEEKLLKLATQFKVVLILGARQVGKSTLLGHCFPTLKHITFDALMDDHGAKADPTRFLNNFPAPIILDEIQYCQSLLTPMKRYVDQSSEKGQYLLTGSQNISVLKYAAESMAGRVGIMQLDAFTFDEIAKTPQNFLQTYLEDPRHLVKKFSGLLPLKHSLYEMIWRGSMPDTLEFSNEDIGSYFNSYIKTYIERDVRLLENIQNLTDFERFFRLAAALTAQEINYTQLGREIGISRITASKWLEILKHTYQWAEIFPYHSNTIKRISKKTKGFLCDTGIACYLQRISSPDALSAHPMLGALFETFISTNLLKLANTLSTPPISYHWRVSGGLEVDLIFERDGKLYPIEIKCKSQITKKDVRGLKSFRETYSKSMIMPGIVISAGNECYEVDDDIFAVPWNAMFS